MSAPERLVLSVAPSPIGPLAFAVDECGVLRGLSFGDGLRRSMARAYPATPVEEGALSDELAEVLEAYFAGDRRALDRVAWSLDGCSAGDDFQARVWKALAEVPAGATISYGEMAKRAGEPGAAQAAGAALNRNPIPLVLACHRVVGVDGSMTGFGGGLERKTWLLRHEGALLI